MHNREHRRIGANPQRQGQQNRRRKARLPEQQSKRLTEIVSEHIHPPPRSKLLSWSPGGKPSFESLTDGVSSRVNHDPQPERYDRQAPNPSALGDEQRLHVCTKRGANVSRNQAEQGAIHPGFHGHLAFSSRRTRRSPTSASRRRASALATRSP